MDAHALIERILEAHEEGKDEIKICNSLVLEPQLDYTGKMARDAYKGWRRFANKGALYAGILDFKVLIEDEGMEHEFLIESAVVNLSRDIVRKIHSGFDPFSFEDIDERKREVASWVQSGFIEQELNWGEMDFQLWTHFGNPSRDDSLLRRAAPRDFMMVFMEKCFDEVERTDKGPARAVEDVLKEYMDTTKEASIEVVTPPIEDKSVKDDFRENMPPNIFGEGTPKWIEPYIDRIERLCEEKGPNPYHPDEE